MKYFFIIIISLLTQSLSAQSLKTMTPETFNSWNTIKETRISNDGQYVVYNVGNESGDPTLHIYSNATGNTIRFHRGSKPQISADNQWLVFKLSAAKDTVRQLKMKKVKKEDLPNDSLVIYHLENRSVITIPDVQSYKLPQEWDDWLVYKKEAVPLQPQETVPNDTTSQKVKKPRKPKKDDGTLLVFYDLKTRNTISYPGVLKYKIAKKQPSAIFSNSGKYDGFQSGVYYFDFKNQKERPLYRGIGTYKKLQLDESGQQAAFIADLDTTKIKARPLSLFYWKNSKDTAALVVSSYPINNLESTAFLSENYQPRFSKDGKTLFYGTAPFPILQDTSLLDEDIVNVEVWHYEDARLHTQQKVQEENDKKMTYLNAWNIRNKKSVALTSAIAPEHELANEGNGKYVLAIDDFSATISSSWDGYPTVKTFYLVDKNSGQRKKVATNLRASPRFSAEGDYLYWYSSPDTAWYAYTISEQKIRQLTDNNSYPFYDELNDRPMLPNSYRIAGWDQGDQHIYIYDRYDIWQIDPKNPSNKKRLTKGRENKTTYRYIRLDREVRTIDTDQLLLLHYFNHVDKTSGYVKLNVKTETVTPLVGGPHSYTRRVTKAKKSDVLIFTKENFTKFPDLQWTDLKFKNIKQISEANPQQSEYGWGTAELFHWTDLNGQVMDGMLIKPPNFDPTKKYPMLVNFYERSSNGLYRHRAPYPHRSTINYSYYANRGYVIFNPDVSYRVGYPGESAYNAVMPGVTALIEKGFVDKDNIGLQGHSWGGYQVAYMVTRTNLFKCAESGAPVVNMFSAYGGIRWGSGLSRMFQYENTQSRIGGTIWDKPLRYLENSPIFFLDKVETPLLILHNDKDGAVPWYQGIELFVGLRRLGKPAWMLNYNDEPHWPVKRQNRMDFNIRMSQFFDYYLKGAAEPQWMKRGVPAVEKGIRQGLESVESLKR